MFAPAVAVFVAVGRSGNARRVTKSL